MIRAIILFLVACPSIFGQSANPQTAFLREVAALYSSQGSVIDPAARVQEDLGFTPAAAEALRSATLEYSSGIEVIDRTLRRLVFERRMQMIAGEKVTVPPEAELVAEADRRMDAYLASQMEELRMRLGGEAFQMLKDFIEAGKDKRQFFPPLPEGTMVKGKAVRRQ